MKYYLTALEEKEAPPTRLRTYHKISLEEFEKKVYSSDKELINDFYSGDAFIITGVVDPVSINEMKKNVIEWGKNREPEYQPMKENARDFHQYIKDDGASLEYNINPVRHSYFFFRWNQDPVGAFKHGNHIWGLIKLLGGFEYDEFIFNTPKDGIVDRAQIAHYPPGLGKIPLHTDPYHNQKAILGVYLSKYGEDFEDGGIYFLDNKDKKVLLEPEIEIGDAVIAYPTVLHGVSTIDKHKKLNWFENPKGRWFLGLYTNDSNENKNRITSHRAQV